MGEHEKKERYRETLHILCILNEEMRHRECNASGPDGKRSARRVRSIKFNSKSAGMHNLVGAAKPKRFHELRKLCLHNARDLSEEGGGDDTCC